MSRKFKFSFFVRKYFRSDCIYKPLTIFPCKFFNFQFFYISALFKRIQNNPVYYIYSFLDSHIHLAILTTLTYILTTLHTYILTYIYGYVSALYSILYAPFIHIFTRPLLLTKLRHIFTQSHIHSQ